VQDNYVSQWGNGDAENPLPRGVVRTPPAEYDRRLDGLQLRPLGYPDAYAPMVGHSNGWPVAWDPESGRAWLTHCYGSVGAGRDLAPDTGTAGELYAVIGHAPRHLDLNIATVGRVIEGMAALAARPRGTGNLGFYDAAKGEQPIRIVRVRLAADLPQAERPQFEVMRTDTEAFSAYVTGRANRGGTFFNRAGRRRRSVQRQRARPAAAGRLIAWSKKEECGSHTSARRRAGSAASGDGLGTKAASRPWGRAEGRIAGPR
jgi:peptidylprolyl isomerase